MTSKPLRLQKSSAVSLQVAGRALLPAAAMLELAGALMSTLGSGSQAALAGVTIPAPLLLNAAEPGLLAASVQPHSGALSAWTPATGEIGLLEEQTQRLIGQDCWSAVTTAGQLAYSLYAVQQ